MALKIISLIFVISLTFGIQNPNQFKDVPFDVNDVINRFSSHHSQPPNSPSRVSDEGRFDQSLIPDLTGEFLIDTSIVYVIADNYQQYPAVAFDGTNYLVVWEDERIGLWDIYGARVTPDGIVLDEGSIPISTAANNQRFPSVAFNGNNYLVVWEDYRSGSPHIYGTQVTQSGQVLDPNGIPISTATSVQGHPSVTLIDTNYLVAWHDHRSGAWDIYGTRVTPAGTVLDTTGIPISTAANDQLTPSVAFDGTNCLVVWSDRRSGTPNIYGARVTPAGSVLDDTGFPIVINTNFNSQYPSVTFGGTNYLVVWQDGRNGPVNWDIYGARVTLAGILLDTNGIPMSTAAGYQQFPSVTFDDTNYLVVWLDDRTNPFIERDIYGTRVSQVGTVLDPTGIPISSATYGQLYPSVAFDGTNYLVVWSDYRSNNISDIYGARVTPTGTVLDPNGIQISTAANSQWSPSVASDGTNYLVVWEENRDSTSMDIYGARIDQNGNVLDPDIPISTGGADQRYPSVAFNGIDYLVVWQNYRSSNQWWDIYGARVNQQGIVLDSNGFAISTATRDQIFPAVGFDGLNYLVVWQDGRRTYYTDIYGARVNSQGSVLDTNGIRITNVSNQAQHASVAFDSTNYLVVWERGDANNDIYGTRVSPGGTVLDPNGIPISTITNSQQEYPSIAFDGSNYLVAWHDYRHGSRNPDIYCSRVTQSGTVLDPNGIPISTATNSQINPSIAFDGTDYLVVWEDYRRRYDLYGAKVSPSGVVIDSFPITTQISYPCYPALARGSGNQILIAYSKFCEQINNHPANSFRIWGKLPPYLGIEENNRPINAKRFMLEVYPNPAKTVMCVRCPMSVKDKTELKIFDALGKLTREIASPPKADRNDQDIKISLKGINPGIYFLRLGKETKKFLVVK
jgi:hypothetical protein